MKNLIAIACASLALPAHADVVVSELTAQSPTWDRPSDNSVMNAGQCGLASSDDSVNNQVPYARFYVRATDVNVPMEVKVVSLEDEPIDFDPFVTIYCEEFDPTAPQESLLDLDDDGAGYPNAYVLTSVPLEVGLDYIVIVSSYSNWAPSQLGRFEVVLGDNLAFFNPCAADLNGDGVLNFFDVSAFLTAFNAQDPIADFNGDGLFNFFDVSAFLTDFNAGCP